MFSRSSALAAALLAGLAGQAAAEEDPVATLRARQERLETLEFALKEAELLARLCDLRPRRAECASRAARGRPETAASGGEALPAAAAGLPQILDIYGSNGRLRATVLDAQGARRVVRPGAALDARTEVVAIGRGSVTLRQNGQDTVLLLGR